MKGAMSRRARSVWVALAFLADAVDSMEPPAGAARATA
jgi:hypothetical protein